jgi:hypothetical protein
MKKSYNSKKRIFQLFGTTFYFSLPTSEKTWQKLFGPKHVLI